MSYRTAKRQPLNDSSAKRGLFGGGYVDNIDNFNMSSMYSPYNLNCRLDGQSIIIRPGHSLVATLTSGVYPKGIGSYLRSDPANDVMVIRHNQDATHKLVTLTAGGTINSISTGASIASNNRMQFTNVGDVVYCMNGSDNYGKLSNTTYSVIADGTTGYTNFAPAFGVKFNSCHRVSGRPTNPSKVYKSVGDNYEAFSTGSGGDVFTFSERVTGLAAIAEALFYFTTNTISVTNTQDITDTAGTFSYSNRSLQVKEGANNHKCIVGSGNEIYYVTSSNTICKLVRGQNVYGFENLDVSHRAYNGITKIMNSLDPDQSAAFGYFLPDKNLIKRHFKSLGSAINDVVVIYDLTKDSFLIDSSKYFYDGLEFKNKNYTISMVEGKVFQDEYGQDDEDAPIPFIYWTKEFYLSDPTFKKILWESRTLLDINELAAPRQEIRCDGGLTDSKTVNRASTPKEVTGGIGVEAMGEFAIGTDGSSQSIGRDSDYVEIDILRTKGNLNKLCKKVQFRFYNGTLAGKVRLKNITAKHEVKDPLVTNITT